MQYVKVDLDGKAYTYGWTGSEPLKRGDRVVVPGNVVNPEQSVRTVLRAMPSPDYDVDKIVNILDRVHLQPRSQVEKALDQLDRNEAKALREDPSMSRPEPHDWDDLIGDDILDFRDEGHAQ